MAHHELIEAATNVEAQSILLAASQHDVGKLKELLQGNNSLLPANVQDFETGFTPLHAAIASCDPGENPLNSLHSNNSPIIDSAESTIRLLLENGAIWNELDMKGETPGCLALRLGLSSLYQIMVEAGFRAEVLLNRLDEFERLSDSDSTKEINEIPPGFLTPTDIQNQIHTDGYTQDSDRERDEVVLQPDASSINCPRFLGRSLTFEEDRLVDSESSAVMMSWEADIMKRTVEQLIPNGQSKVLNIGHGMGIFDDLIQSTDPSCHHIIEAHDQVLERMKDGGWYQKAIIHGGRWQDVAPSLIEEGYQFDAIFFDTYAESYQDFKQFFDSSLLGLMCEGGRMSFFNGLGADRQICYDVYAKIVDMDLLEAGFDVKWSNIEVRDLNGSSTWVGIKRPYWTLKQYRLPIVTFLD